MPTAVHTLPDCMEAKSRIHPFARIAATLWLKLNTNFRVFGEAALGSSAGICANRRGLRFFDSNGYVGTGLIFWPPPRKLQHLRNHWS